jgi:hypothetical protein
MDQVLNWAWAMLEQTYTLIQEVFGCHIPG